MKKVLKWWFRYFVVSYTIYGLSVNLLNLEDADEAKKNSKEQDVYCEIHRRPLLFIAFSNFKEWVTRLKES